MDIKDTAANPLATGDIVRQNKQGTFRLAADLGDSKWSGTWITGRTAGQARTIIVGEKTIRIEMAPRPEPVAAAAAKPARAPRAKKAPAAPRQDLPEGWVTPYGLAAAITARGLYKGSLPALPGRFVYTRALRPSKSNPFPGRRIDGRMAVDLEAGIAWWTATAS